MIHPDWQPILDAAMHFALVGMGVTGLALALTLIVQGFAAIYTEAKESDTPKKPTMNESDLIEMVNSEMDDWQFVLHELGLGDALPQWTVDNLRERMLYVAHAAANGRKSKSEIEA